MSVSNPTDSHWVRPRGRIVLRGGHVVDAREEAPRRADVAVEDGVVAEIGDVAPRTGDEVLDSTGRLVMPGLVDAHSHTDGLLGDESVQRSLLRQGVTSVITGQDGVSYAPGDGAYGSECFAAINGPHPTYPGGGVAAYLATVDGASRLNAAYLVPAGTVLSVVCVRSREAADASQLASMVCLVADGLR